MSKNKIQTPKNNEAVIYARVSSREQEKEGFSIPAQLKLLREYAEKNGLHVITEFSDAETAKKVGRKNYNKMLKFLKENPTIRTVLVEKTDRLYRNFKDYVTLEDFDLEIHLVKESTIISKDSKSHDKFMHGIKVLMAKNYIDNLSEEIRKGIKEKIEGGGYPSKAPVGYKHIRVDGRAKIEVDSTQAPYIKKIFEMVALGNSIETTRKAVIEDGFRMGKSRTKPTKSAIGKMLHNPLYCGKMRIKGVVYEANHEPIISLELYNKVQNTLTTDKSRSHDRLFSYAGLIKCGHCGCQLTAELKKGKYVYYHCTGRRGGTCKKDYIREEKIEDVFKDLMAKIAGSISDEIIEATKEALKEANQEKIEYEKAQYESIQKQINILNNRLSKLYDDKLDGNIPEEMWKEKNNLWHAEKDSLSIKLQNINTSSKEFYEGSNLLLDFLKDAPRMYEEANPEKKREILNFVGSNFTYKDKKVSVMLTSVFDYLLNNPFLKNGGAGSLASKIL